MSEVLSDSPDYVTATQAIVYALDGNDRVFTSQVSPRLYGGEGSDFLGAQLAGPTGETKAYGGGGNDTLHGYNANDELFGDDGNDFLAGGRYDYIDAEMLGVVSSSLYGVSGNDFLDGGSGSDSLYGFDGDDRLYGGDGDDLKTVLINSKDDAATDTFYTLIRGGLYGGFGNDYLDGGRGNDFLDGGPDNDLLLGGDGHDIMRGGAHVDRLEGGFGNDRLEGDGGNDTLEGGGNNDLLIGGPGQDSLTGGGNLDHFLFDVAPTAANRDTIQDFYAPLDTIRLENAIYAAIPTGVLAAFRFKLGAVATDPDDRIIYNPATGVLIYDSNGNAAGGHALFATLLTKPTINHLDFVIV